MYLTYDDYLDMGGTLDIAAFDSYEYEARIVLDWYTFNRLRKEKCMPESVKRLMMKLIELADFKARAYALGQSADGMTSQFTGSIASQSNDGYSTSFNVLSASDALNRAQSETQRLINQYLQGEVDSLGHKLLYRGLYPNE